MIQREYPRHPAIFELKPFMNQLAHRQRFSKAVAYAKQALADSQLMKVYEKAGAKKANELSKWRSQIIFSSRNSHTCKYGLSYQHVQSLLREI